MNVTEEQGERQGQPADDEDVVAREEAAAAAEAGSIGGHRDESSDEAARPVSEGGGGEEGFELAEEELVDEAEQGQQHNPLADAGRAEAEDPRSEYGEPDRLGSTEREEEPPDDAEES
jgi:hypothetical protein